MLAVFVRGTLTDIGLCNLLGLRIAYASQQEW